MDDRPTTTVSDAHSAMSKTPFGKQKLPGVRKSNLTTSMQLLKEEKKSWSRKSLCLDRMASKDQDFKIQMSRMKTFYDRPPRAQSAQTQQAES